MDFQIDREKKLYKVRRQSMSTTAEVQDPQRLQAAIAAVRSDSSGVHRRAWVVVGHVDNNPNLIDVVQEDTDSPDASLDEFRAQMQDDQVMYGLLRLTTAVDVSTTVKFIYVHWIGEKVPFARRGRFGVVHGSIEEHFSPFHSVIDTNTIDDLDEAQLTQKLEEGSMMKSKVVESYDSAPRQERGFLQHQTKRNADSTYRSVAPKGAVIEVVPELNEAIGEVRSDASPTSWVLAGFEEGNIKKPMVVVATGTGDIEELKEALIDDQVMYGLYRVADIIDDIKTVKFVYMYWIGEGTKPLTKGRVSALAGPVEQVFSPVHTTLSFSNRYDIEEHVILDKVMAGSGSKSFVMDS